MVRIVGSRMRVGSAVGLAVAMSPLRIGALGLTVLAAGCSADVARFDFPGAGFADRGGATGSLPMPKETVYSRPTGYLGGNPEAAPPPAPVTGSTYEPPRPVARDKGVQMSALPAPVPAAPPASVVNDPPAPARQASRAPHAAPTSAPAAHQAPLHQAAAPVGEEIEVKQGDTLYGLSKKHRVSINELMQANNLRSPSLKPGQKLVLPANGRAQKPLSKRAGELAQKPAMPATPPPPNWNATYTVRSGDSLYAIALQHKIKLAELQQVNGISDVRRVRPGTVLKVPGEGGGQPAPASAPPHAPIAAAVPSPSPAAAQPAEAGPSSSMQPTIIIRPKMASLEDDKGKVNDVPPVVGTPPAESKPAAEARSASKPDKVASAAGGAVGAGGKLRWPAKGKVVNGFGQRSDGTHNDGIDVAVPMGTEVHAAESGEVAYVGSELKAYGNLVLIRHSNGWVTAYAHNEEILVKRGDKVKRGQVLAKAGKTGQVDQPTIHFELRQGKDPIDPLPHLEKL